MPRSSQRVTRYSASTSAAAPKAERGQRSRQQWLALALGAGCLLALLLGASWLVATGLMAKSEVNQIRNELPQLRSALAAGDVTAAGQISDELREHAGRAHELTTGPAWWVTANLPYLGSPAQVTRVIAAAGDRAVRQMLPGAMTLTQDLRSTKIRTGAKINLAALKGDAGILTAAARTADAVAGQVATTPSSTWLSPINRARGSILSELNSLRSDLDGADNSVQTLLPMLGENGTRRYFIGMMNEAEARGLGGLPGQWGIVTADHGVIDFTQFGSDSELLNVHVNPDLSADYLNHYGPAAPAQDYRNSDISPNFPDAAKIWAAMWEKKTGQHVDGAFAVDPVAFSYVLAVTGPLTLDDGRQLTADNIASFAQSDIYKLFKDNAQQDRYLTQVTQGSSEHILTGAANTVDLVRALERAASERRLMIFSDVPAEERRIVDAGYGGVLGGTDAPYSGFSVINAAGSKLDYYLSRSMTYTRQGCGAGSTATGTLTLTNKAPSRGLPSYVTIRADNPTGGYKTGDNRETVEYFATAGARVTRATLDGKALPVSVSTLNGLTVFSTSVEIPVGASRTLSVSTAEPPATGALHILRQPLVQPISVEVSGSTCR